MNQNMKLEFRKKDMKRESEFKKQLYFSLSLSQFQGFFNESFVQQSSHEKNTRASASASVLGVNIQG